MSYFSHCYDQTHAKQQLKGRITGLACSLRGIQVTVVGEGVVLAAPWWQDHVVGDTGSQFKKQRWGTRQD